MRLPYKDPAEIKLLRFALKGDVEPGTTIDAVEMTVAVVDGDDATAGAVLLGAAQINNAALEVLQRVQGGLDGRDYEVRCLVTDTTGLKHLVSAVLPVRRFVVRAAH